MELTVLGASGSYASARSGPCSGYLLREGDTAIWLDCGNGSFATLQEHVDPGALSAVVITHEHPDHCVDLYGLHVMMRYGRVQDSMPVFAPERARHRLGALVSSWGQTFEWTDVYDGDAVAIGAVDLCFSRTDHPPPTFAVEATAGGRRLVYTSDTGPDWSVSAFTPAANLVLSEASYLHEHRPTPIHLSAREAGEAAWAAAAERLVLTHLWPEVDPERSAAEGSEAFGAPVAIAVPHLTLEV
ncbi:MAG: MBL fold metallo-hydrolase [Actinobacteria bacterium]|nr:MBL fold metallo-hydrolase [Actinomycetota bacterium]